MCFTAPQCMQGAANGSGIGVLCRGRGEPAMLGRATCCPHHAEGTGGGLWRPHHRRQRAVPVVEVHDGLQRVAPSSRDVAFKARQQWDHHVHSETLVFPEGTVWGKC